MKSNYTRTDPNNCNVYYYCSNTGAVAENFLCPKDYVFSSKTKLCTRRYPCQKVNCANKKNHWIPFTGNEGYYAFCGVPEIFMFKCIDEDNQIFNPKTNLCEYNCRADNKYYADRTDCHSYISCQRKNGRFVATVIKCPPNYYYNESIQQCVRGTCESEITTPPPTQSTSTLPPSTGT